MLLETSGAVWGYWPHRHKTRHKGKKRFVAIGPKAQEVLRPWLKTDLKAYLFSPHEAVVGWNAERRTNRKSTMTPL